jgi:hypothetical protein
MARWWRRQTPVQQDRIATLGPLLSVLLFLAAMVAAFWYLRWEERQREAESVWRDAEVAQQQLRLRLADNEQAMSRMARDLATRSLGAEALLDQASDLLLERGEVAHVAWVGADRETRAVLSDRPFHPEANPEARRRRRPCRRRAAATRASRRSRSSRRCACRCTPRCLPTARVARRCSFRCQSCGATSSRAR